MDNALYPPERAATALLQAARPLGVEAVMLDAAYGRTLAEDVTSPLSLPPFDRAAMDGYAVRYEESWPELVVAGTIRAGDAPGILKPGTALRIFTGAALPAGADTVIEQEACRVVATETRVRAVQIQIEGSPGRNVMKEGHEIGMAAPVMGAGTRLSPYHVSLLASIGRDRVLVRRRPRVSIVETGDELQSPATPLAPGHIYASNGSLVRALVAEWGGEVLEMRRVPDVPEATKEALLGLAPMADLVVVTGGVSVGDFDCVPAALEEVGRRLFWGVGIHPGRATAGGVVAGTPVAALSGNPGAAVVGWLTVVAPFWAAWHGGRLSERWQRVPLAGGFRKRTREPRFVPVRVRGGVAAADLPQGADVVTVYLEADGFAVLPAGSGPLDADAVVDVWEPGGIGGRYPRWSGPV